MNWIIDFISGIGLTVLPFFILLGILVFVHEMGHFLVAKWSGVRVEVFSLGFGKKIFSFRRGDTTYCISLIPLGGYVKMFGDDPASPIAEEDKKFSFTHKPLYKRFAVVLAGPLMNLFFAILVFFIVATFGEEKRAPVLGEMSDQSVAYTSGLRRGDLIVSVQGNEIASYDELVKSIEDYPNQTIELGVIRKSSPVSIYKVPVELGANPNILSWKDEVGVVEGISSMHQAAMVGVLSGSLAEQAGIKTGDLVKSVNGFPVETMKSLEELVAEKAFSFPLNLEVEQYSQRPMSLNSKKQEVEKVEAQTFVINGDKNSKPISALIDLGLESSELYLQQIVAGSPAEKAGFKQNDKVIRIGQQPVRQWESLLSQIKGYKGQTPLDIEVQRGAQKVTLTVVPEMTSQENMLGVEEKRFTLGVIQWRRLAVPPLTTIQANGFVDALKFGVDRSIEVTSMTVLSFVRLIEAKISPKHIGGVLSIGQAASETFKIGLIQFLQMMGLISINLFVLNLLPVPMLDGGHLVFYTIEAIKGAPLSMRKMEIAQQVGLVLLMSLMALALFNDFSRFFGFI